MNRVSNSIIVDLDINDITTIGTRTSDLSESDREKLLDIRFNRNKQCEFITVANKSYKLRLISLEANMVTFADTCAKSGSYVYVYGFYCSSLSNCHLYCRKRLTVQDF